MTASPQIAPVSVGVIGVGAISEIYFKAIDRSPLLCLAATASRLVISSAAKAATFGGAWGTVDELLSNDGVEIVLNLTPASEHEVLNARIIASGKHLYSEKPLALTLGSAERLVADAESRGVHLASAPDTFFGGTQQYARELVDKGAIGKPVFGSSFVGRRGIEYFHPNPVTFYRSGAEGPYDLGPYYITQWVNLLGPVQQVFAVGNKGASHRTVHVGPQSGVRFAVEVPTSYNIIMTFEDASVTLVISLDVAAHERRFMELYGTGGTLTLPDPNHFGGGIELASVEGSVQSLGVPDRPFSAVNRTAWGGRQVSDYRGIGLLDLALAIRTCAAPRCGPQLFVHVVEVMEAIMRSAREGVAVSLRTSCARPSPIGSEPRDALLTRMSVSPAEIGEITAG